MTSRPRIVFMGTPEFAVPSLQALATVCDVAAVYCQPDRPVGRGLEVKAPPVKVAAEALGLPVFQPESLKADAEVARLRSFGADLFIVVAYGQILRRNVLEIPPRGCVNVHSSLLPRWRGAAPIHWALLAGDPVTGVTTMFMNEKLDAGNILMTAETSVGKETVTSLHDRLAQMGAELIVKTVAGLMSGTLVGVPQDESLVTLAPKLEKSMEFLDPAMPADVLDRRVRALNPWPGTSVGLEGLGRLRIKRASVAAGVSGPSGKVFVSGKRLFLGTAQGVLELLEVQEDGRRAVKAEEFLNRVFGSGLQFPFPVKSP